MAKQLDAFKDFIGSEVARQTPLGIMSREDTIDSLSAARMDQVLSKNSTALRLAQTMGARYLLVASIDSLGTETRHISAYGLDQTITLDRLRISYRVLCGSNGESAHGASLTADEKQRASSTLKVEQPNLSNQLLHEASVKLAENVGQNFDRILGACRSNEQSAPERVSFSVTVDIKEFSSVPVAIVDESDQAMIKPSQLHLEPFGVSVELDGFAIGSASPTFKGKATKGVHKLRLSRPGFESWQRNIKLVSDGQEFTAALTIDNETEAQIRRWARFLQHLKEREEITNVQTKVLKGLAQTLRQSGIRLDLSLSDLVRYLSNQ